DRRFVFEPQVKELLADRFKLLGNEFRLRGTRQRLLLLLDFEALLLSNSGLKLFKTCFVTLCGRLFRKFIDLLVKFIFLLSWQFSRLGSLKILFLFVGISIWLSRLCSF